MASNVHKHVTMQCQPIGVQIVLVECHDAVAACLAYNIDIYIKGPIMNFSMQET